MAWLLAQKRLSSLSQHRREARIKRKMSARPEEKKKKNLANRKLKTGFGDGPDNTIGYGKSLLKKSPLRSGNIDEAEKYGPHVLWKITLFCEMWMSQKTAKDEILVQSSTAMLLSDREGGEEPGHLKCHQYVLKS